MSQTNQKIQQICFCKLHIKSQQIGKRKKEVRNSSRNLQLPPFLRANKAEAE